MTNIAVLKIMIAFCKSWRFWWCQEELRICLRKGENVNHVSFDGVEKKSHVCQHQKQIMNREEKDVTTFCNVWESSDTKKH